MTQRKQWSEREDEFLIKKIKQNEGLPQAKKLKWGEIADLLNQQINEVVRTGKQCRQRWHNQLDPEIVHQEWSYKEQTKLFDLQKKIGNKWAAIALELPGRTDNNVKNYFYSTLRKSLRKVNTFIGINKRQLKGVKQFKQNSLSKLLAVADHKYQNKVNIKKDSVQNIAVEIKNQLIQICNFEPTQANARNSYMNVVQKLQQFNRNCKKRKGKKKQTAQEKLVNDNISSQQQQELEQEPQKQQQQQQEIKLKQPKSKSKKNSKKSSQAIIQQERNRSRDNEISKKNSRKGKQKQENPTPVIKKKQSLRNQNNQNSPINNFDNKISLDLRRLEDSKSMDNRLMSSNLFKSFSSNNQFNIISREYQNQQNPLNRRTTVRRQPSNSINFFQNIKQVKNQLSKKQSRRSQFPNSENEDYVNDLNNMDRPLFFTKQSSFRQFPPMQKQMSFKGILDNSSKYEQIRPQMKKLRSYTKQQSFINEYPMNNQDF